MRRSIHPSTHLQAENRQAGSGGSWVRKLWQEAQRGEGSERISTACRPACLQAPHWLAVPYRDSVFLVRETRASSVRSRRSAATRSLSRTMLQKQRTRREKAGRQTAGV